MLLADRKTSLMPDELFSNRLLVIDDDPEFGALIKKAAKGSEFEVVVTADPVGFAKLVRSFRPTVIMLDLNMPGTDGIQLLRLLAADRSPAKVILSSGADGRVLEAAMRLGLDRGLDMCGTLPKPIRIERLREMLAGFKQVSKELLAIDLADGIAYEQLSLEYQPKLDCALGRFTGVEALARWHHPVEGMIPPDEFIPLAEETDLINRVTDWVVATAARQTALWQAENVDLEVAINLSAKDIEDLDLPERLSQHCQDAGIDPSSLTLELTETGAMREAVQMMDVLTRLRLKGFRLSIDDFGTGYSSLVQLQRLPFSEIKIDKSFVTSMNWNEGCRTIVKAVTDLAHNLGLKSVAEGVEDQATLDALIAMGCDFAQGYHLSRPVAAERIPDLVRDHGNAPMRTTA
jgi:EAL domain-containing protein (putative c-di-GMP-specific phosphodiesterase class I)/AmiR/NasT family two-component response regulator